MNAFPTLRSIPDPAALLALVRAEYGVPATGITLLRSLVNDVYQVDTGTGPLILKFYRRDRGESHLRWEIDLITYLVGAGIPTPGVVSRADGDVLTVLPAPEGPRCAVLFTHAGGTPPRPPFPARLYRDYGRVVAAVHSAGAGFVSEHARRPDPSPAESVEAIRPYLSASDARVITDLAGRAAADLERLDPHLPKGIRHGDVSLDNVRITGGGLVLFDFDLAGYGPPAADLCGVRTTAHWPDFRTAYRTVRDLAPAEIAALPAFQVTGTVANLRFHLLDKPAWRGRESVAEGWAERDLQSLRDLAAAPWPHDGPGAAG